MYQGGNQSQGRLGGGEGRVHLRGLGEGLGITLESFCQVVEKQGSTKDELPVENNHAKEPLKGGCREAVDGQDVLAVGHVAGAGD